MEKDQNTTSGRDQEKKDKRENDKTWIEKAEDWMDDTADKLHESETYQKADQKLEDLTKKLFRKAGRWWGKL